MKDIKLMLSLFVLGSLMLMAIGASEDSWDLGSSEDWLSAGTPVYHIGSFYYPYSDLSAGTLGFLNTYQTMPIGYSNYYQTYTPIVLNKTGIYTPYGNYLLGYNNPYFYDPQAELDLAIANHAYQKSLANYYSQHNGIYPYFMDV